MKNSEKDLNDREAIKNKIRARYKGVDKDMLTVIPMKQKTKLFEDTATKKVAAYCRVSTDDVQQTSSYELQKNFYEEMISEHKGWELVGIYADEGISGTSMLHRDEFNRMIDDCIKGKIDLIVTKSVSRFARNIVDCIKTQRMLGNLNPPVGVFFETEHIYSLDSTSEMMMAVLSAAAQEESHTKSEIMNISIEQRFSRGIFLTPKLLGYDLDEDGNLVINDDEADTVRLCYYLLLSGFSLEGIKDVLTQLKRKTKKGNVKWTSSTIRNVIENERHCGDVVSRKTFTPDYLTHKTKKNENDRNQYIQHDHHEPIVSREVYNAATYLLKEYHGRFHGRGFRYPLLKVIQEGLLCGYVPVNLHWSGFDLDDYAYATEYAYTIAKFDTVHSERQKVKPKIGLKGYRIIPSEMFEVNDKPTLKIKKGKFTFNIECIKRLDNCSAVEILFNPIEKVLAVRPAEETDWNAVFWSRMKDGKIQSVTRTGSVFLQGLSEKLMWKEECQYEICGTSFQEYEDKVLLFALDEAVITEQKSGKTYYPEYWIKEFGREEDAYAKSLVKDIHFSERMNLDAEPIAVEKKNLMDEDDLDEICEQAEQIIEKLKYQVIEEE